MKLDQSGNQKSRGRWLLLITLLVTFAVWSISSLTTPQLARKDAAQNFVYAYNLSKHGVFSLDRSDLPTVEPDSIRGPAYPALLAAAMLLIPDTQRADLACYLEKDETCDALQKKIKLANVLIFSLLIAATFLIGIDLLGSTAIALIPAGLVMAASHVIVSEYATEGLAATLLLIHSYALYRLANRRPRPLLWALAAGLSLGLLTLTKPIYLYWLALLSLVWLLGLALPRFRQAVPAVICVAALLGSAWTISGTWMLRNLLATGDFTLSGRGGSVLALRAEYDTMTWREYLVGYVMYSHGVGGILLKRHFEREDYRRFIAASPHSFRSQSRGIFLPLNFKALTKATEEHTGRPIAKWSQGVVASRLPPGEPLTDSSARRAALEVIRENWLMHLALIPLFAYRGVYLMLPLLAAVTFVALRKQDLGLLSFLAPMLYAIAIYASVSHYLPRYSVHGIPCALLSVAWLAKLASQRIRLSHA